MSKRILIIDNESEWTEILRDDLGDLFEVEIVGNPKVVLVKLEESSYDLIIINSQQIDTLKAVREIFPEKNIIVVTEQPTVREAVAMYRQGVLDYFPKDFRRDVTSNRIREVLRKPHNPVA